MSIANVAPIPKQIATAVPNKNKILAIGRRYGFWNLLILSINGTVINPAGTAAIANTPNNLLGTTRKIWNTARLRNSILAPIGCLITSLSQNRT